MIAALVAALWIGPAFSGSWFTPERNGEGFTLQVLDNGTAHVLWFTYPPPGSQAQQAWIYASGGRIDEDRVRFDSAFTTRGPRFGAQFDPAAVQLSAWGTIELRFTGCDEAELSYAGPAAWGSGTRRLRRLTSLAELECAGKRRVGDSGSRTLAGLRSRSGGWFDPAHNGEGWQVEELPDGRALVYWFTYDDRGEQAWTVGVSPTSGERIGVTENLRPVGTRFGAAFDSSQIRNTPWGRLELDLTSCDQGTLRYESSISAFGSGSLRPQRLSIPAGAVCIDGAPALPQNATWASGAPLPVATSESAIAALGASFYVAGGFGGPRVLQRYDAGANAWTRLADLPGGRDHLLATAVAGDVYVAGGNSSGGGDQSSTGWRYVVAANRWENVPQLPPVVASGAAALGGFAWFGNTDGSLTQFDPRTGKARYIAPATPRVERDHSQVVAFQGELWMIGGRLAETAWVSIFDPAGERWREGPPMRVPRAGFAAAASSTLLIVAGGEVLFGGLRTLGSVEGIAAGEARWSEFTTLPTPVHGVVGAIHGNGFYVLGGSTRAGGAQNPGTVQILRW